MGDTRLTTFELALLGLIDLQPQSGYDIHRLFSTTPMGMFSSSPGAIYPALSRLEKRGMLTSRIDSTTPARPRRIYSTSADGQRALVDWLRIDVSRDELMRHPSIPLLRFSLSEARLTRKEAIGYLQGFGRQARSYLSELRGHLENLLPRHVVHPRLSLEHGIETLECQIRWIDRAIAELQAADESGGQKQLPKEKSQ